MARAAGTTDLRRPWLRSYDEHVPADVEPDDRGPAELLELAVERWPASNALCFLGRDLSYRELKHDVEQLSRSLVRLGVRAGDRVALVLPDGPPFVVSLFAVWRVGGLAVPLGTTRTAEQMAAALADSGAVLVVCTDKLLPVVDEAREHPATAVREVVVSSATDYLPALDRLTLAAPARGGRARAAEALRAGTRSWTDELRRARTLPPVPVRPGDASSPAAPAVLLYPRHVTAGSGTVLSGAHLCAAGRQAVAWLTNARPGRESILVGLPLGSAAGLALGLVAGTLLGAALQFLPRSAVDAGAPVLAAMRPTLAVGPPAFLDELIAAPAGPDLRSLRLCVVGPDLLPVADLERYEALTSARVVAGLSLRRAPLVLARPVRGSGGGGGAGGAGIPLPSTEARVVDRAGVPVPPGSPGTLEVRGPQVSRTAWADGGPSTADLSSATSGMADTGTDGAGWLRTALSACMGPDGWFEVVPRR